MNVIMADMQSSGTALSGVAPEAVTDDGSFTHLMDQQLNQDSDLTAQLEYPQVIENNEFIPDNDMLIEINGFAMQGTESGSDNLASENQPLAIDMPVESVSVDIVKIENSIPFEYPLELDQIAAPVIGDLLPASGKTLPQSGVSQENLAMAMSAQENLPGLNKSMFVDPSRQLAAAIDPKAARQVVEIQPMDLALNSSTFEMPEPAKPVPAIDNINFSRGLEYQPANSGLQEAIDINSIQTRTAASFSANLSLQQPSSTLPPQLETLALNNPRDTGAWGAGLGERINWMINQKMNTATIRLDPPALGRLDVHIQLADDATNVTINTQHGQTRDMIESASHRLREFLQENGYQNVNVDVSHQQEQNQQASEQTGDHGMEGSDDGLTASNSSGNAEDEGNRFFSSDSIVDYFA